MNRVQFRDRLRDLSKDPSGLLAYFSLRQSMKDAGVNFRLDDGFVRHTKDHQVSECLRFGAHVTLRQLMRALSYIRRCWATSISAHWILTQ